MEKKFKRDLVILKVSLFYLHLLAIASISLALLNGYNFYVFTSKEEAIMSLLITIICFIAVYPIVKVIKKFNLDLKTKQLFLKMEKEKSEKIIEV